MKNTLLNLTVIVLVFLFSFSVTNAATSVFHVFQGGTNSSSFAPNSIVTSDSLGTTLIATSSSPLTVTQLNATSTTATSTFAYTVRATCFSTNGTTCITGGGAGTVTSIATNNGITGGTITTTGTIGLAALGSAGVLGAPTATVPTVQATSTLYGVGTNGFVLTEVNGVPTWVATSTVTAPITYSPAAGYGCATCLTANQSITLSGAVTGTGATSIVTAFGVMNQGVLANPASSATIPTANATTTLYGPAFTALTTNYNLGQGSTTPWGALSANPTALNTGPQFVIGSSTITSFIVGSNGRVGIATTSPFGNLSVQGTVGEAGPFFDVSTSTTANVGSSTEIFRIDKFGNTIAGLGPTMKLSVGSTSPWALLSVGTDSFGTTTTNQALFAVGSSSKSIFNIYPTGSISIGTTSPYAGYSVTSKSTIINPEYVWGDPGNAATSTSPVLDFSAGNSQLYRTGFSATTFTFSNVRAGVKVTVNFCNPGGTAGAVTWPTGAVMIQMTSFTQTTTAGKCDLYTFIATQGTSTPYVQGYLSPSP